MAAVIERIVIERDAPIPTWFGIGGRARRLARPTSIEELRQCVQIDTGLRVLGDGANLLVDDEGVEDLVVVLDQDEFTRVRWEADGRVVAGAGANLPRLVTESLRGGLAGLEGLGGIPATVGGAAIMNAGGAFGQFADAIVRVHALERTGDGRAVTLERDQIEFSYRHSGLENLIVTSVELGLTAGDPAAVRERLKEVMEYKKRSQPMADRSAGCVFKNPTLTHEVAGIGGRGERVSAGMLIDRAGCKGMRVGTAVVSDRHANFIVTDPRTSKARNVIDLMALVGERVRSAFGLTLEPEVVVWRSRG